METLDAPRDGSWLAWGQREGEPEGAALAGRALDADAAAVALDDGLADVEAEAQAGAGPALLLDAGHAVEAIPDVRLLGGGEAGAAVAHGHAGDAIREAQGGGDGGVGRGVFERVGQVVRHHLA